MYYKVELRSVLEFPFVGKDVSCTVAGFGFISSFCLNV